MKLTKTQRIMLEKCAAAARFTSTPAVLSPDERRSVILSLQTKGLVKWANGWRLTDAGRAALKDGAK